MTRFPDEAVIAYVDNRMVDEERAAFDRALRVDKSLADRVAAHAWMTRQITAAFGPPPTAEADDLLIDWLNPDRGKVIPLATGHRRSVRRGFAMAALSGAIAASLAFGVLIGRGTPSLDSMLILDRSGKIAARGLLAEGLSNRLSGEQGPVRIGITFHTAGEICRTFSTAGGTSGLACRQGSGWSVPLVANAGSETAGSGEYRLAGEAVSPEVMAQVDRLIVGAPLSPKEEAGLRDRGWH